MASTASLCNRSRTSRGTPSSAGSCISRLLAMADTASSPASTRFTTSRTLEAMLWLVISVSRSPSRPLSNSAPCVSVAQRQATRMTTCPRPESSGGTLIEDQAFRDLGPPYSRDELARLSRSSSQFVAVEAKKTGQLWRNRGLVFASGTYEFVSRADASLMVGETNEGNNQTMRTRVAPWGSRAGRPRSRVCATSGRVPPALASALRQPGARLHRSFSP